MKKLFVCVATLIGLSLALSAYAADTWVGNVVVHNTRRDNNKPLQLQCGWYLDNLADYNDVSITLEFYKKGITDTPGVEVWKRVNARVELVKDSSLEVIGKGALNVVGTNGNNALYNLSLRGINPNTVAGYDPEMRDGGKMKTHLNVFFDDVLMDSLPFEYSYVP